MPESGTGFSLLPDVGTLSYNGVRWNSLYKSTVTGTPVADEAKRTTKLMDYSLEVQGTVTLAGNNLTTDNTWKNLRKQLTVHGAPLLYSGNGFGSLNVNVPGGAVQDVVWGPVPELLGFKPLGAGLGAEVHWRVTVRIPEMTPPGGSTSTLSTVPGAGLVAALGPGANNSGPVLQYNYECGLTFDEDGYAGLRIRGTLEVPLSRLPNQARQVQRTVDDYRQRWLNIQVDLNNYKVTRRTFNYSRDKRTCEWEFAAEELAPMGLPPGATKARGRMSVRGHPIAKSAGGLGVFSGIAWTVSLTATYTVHKKFPRRTAAWAFYALLWYRMHASDGFPVPSTDNADNAPQQPARKVPFFPTVFLPGAPLLLTVAGLVELYQKAFNQVKNQPAAKKRAVLLTDFGFDEGLYEDSKTMTFNASWVLLTPFANILEATGVWRWLPNSVGGPLWAASIQDVSGWRSQLAGRLDPRADVIVDFGGGGPTNLPPFRPELAT
jgi:hypothetical protein